MEQVVANILPKPHSAAQKEIIFSGKISYAVYAGKRWGKTLAGCEKLIIEGTKDPGLYWWVGLTWKAASMKRAWRTMKYFHKQIWRAKGLDDRTIADNYVRNNDKELYFPTGVDKEGNFECKFVVWFRTADNPESIQGEGPKGIVIDEIAFMPQDVWENKIEPCTIDNAAWVLMLTTSNDMVWFEDFWQRIKSGTRKTWKAIEVTTFDNPKWSQEPHKSKLDEIIADTPQEVVDREYYCIRRSSATKPFDPAALKDCKNEGVTEIPYDPKKYYVAFVDGSGGGQNAYALSISHKEIENGQEVYIQDLMKARNFAHTKATTEEYADDCKRYGVKQIVGDKFSGMWIINEFLTNEVVYVQCDKSKSDLYQLAVPVINQRRAKFLDDGKGKATTLEQLKAIEYKLLADHYKYVKGPNMNEDKGNVFCGNIYQLHGTHVSLEDFSIGPAVREATKDYESVEDLLERVIF